MKNMHFTEQFIRQLKNWELFLLPVSEGRLNVTRSSDTDNISIDFF